MKITKKNGRAIKISWVSPSVRLARTNKHGMGVIAHADIKKGERVVVLGGFVISIPDLRRMRKTSLSAYNFISTIGYQVDDDLVSSPITRGQLSSAEYLNHSCDANCGFKGQMSVIAMRNLQKGEELTIDYALCVTSDLLLFQSPCLCGASTCRKLISAQDWKIPALQKRYHGYFQPYIQERINELNTTR